MKCLPVQPDRVQHGSRTHTDGDLDDITMIANQSRRMAGDCFIVATLSAERGRRTRVLRLVSQD